MIISAPVLRRRGVEPASPPVREATNTMMGVEVEVLLEAAYNGPNHKSLGVCLVGSTIRIAGGSYADWLIDQGYVRRVVSAPAVHSSPQDVLAKRTETGNPLAVPTRTVVAEDGNDATPPKFEELNADGWQVLLDAGISATQAKAVWDAGFTSKDQIALSFDQYGCAKLIDVPQIGLNSAQKLVRWAGRDPQAV